MIVSVRRATQLRPSAARDRQGQNSASEELKLYDTSSLRDIAGAGATAAGETVTSLTSPSIFTFSRCLNRDTRGRHETDSLADG